MPLRPADNPNTDLVVMQAMAQVACQGTGSTQNTVVAPANVYVQSEDVLQLPATVFPLLHLESLDLVEECIGEEYAGTLQVRATYYDRWDTQTLTMDQVWANIALDVERVKSNLMDNQSLAVGASAHAVSLPKVRTSPYRGEVDQTTVPGMTLVKRYMDITVELLPYDV